MKKKKLSRGLKMIHDDRKFWPRNKRAANRMFGADITNRTANRTTTRKDFRLSTMAISNNYRTRTMAVSNDNTTRTVAISNDKRNRTTKFIRTMANRKYVTAPARLLPCTAPNITPMSPTIPIIDGRSRVVSQAVTFFIVGSIALAFLYFLVRSAMMNIPYCRQLLR
eukprot:Seg827.10 transcript_id=Seg827.10/GoldUCD/mRNA.D3Y31 product="hypothetical protein" protein_id=Seg827.10/GoldUCD/D3Y31